MANPLLRPIGPRRQRGLSTLLVTLVVLGILTVIVLYSTNVAFFEQRTANNPIRCFNWGGEYGNPDNLTRGKGENLSIKEMVDKALADHGGDPKRVFVVGFSAGGGMAAIMPVYTGVTALAFFASMGLPGLSGFISEILILLGTWQRYPVLTILGASGVILTAGYLLWTIQRVYLGPPNEKYLKFPEISGREMFTLVPLGVIVIIVGIYPSVVLDMLRASLDQINQIVIPHL